MYFNLPKGIIGHMARPERLVLKHVTGKTKKEKDPSGPKSFPTIKEVIDYFMVEDQPDHDGEGDDESFEQRVYERENMANLLLFEVEVGSRTCVVGGFTTNGWVTRLSSEDNENNGSFESGEDHREIQGRGGSFIFNLTDNLRLDEVTSIDTSTYVTKAFATAHEQSGPSDESSSDDEDNPKSHSEKSREHSQLKGQLKFGHSALVIKVSSRLDFR